MAPALVGASSRNRAGAGNLHPSKAVCRSLILAGGSRCKGVDVPGWRASSMDAAYVLATGHFDERPSRAEGTG